jgi:thiamine biosynthesis lipoprotein
MTVATAPCDKALGTYVELAVTDSAALPMAQAMLRSDLAELDHACSRFRSDSDLTRANAAAGTATPVSSRLRDAVRIAIDVARETDGLVDPTLGTALIEVGYDRDYAELPTDTPDRLPGWDPSDADPLAASWESIVIDDARGTITVPAGVRLDLGATAKARGADLAAERIAETLGVGVMVSLGGDVAIGGPAPEVGWAVRVVTSTVGDVGDAETVMLTNGGIATSSPGARTWLAGGERQHHILDPRTRRPVSTPWSSVSVVASTCVTANAATTAAVVRGDAAPRWLAGSCLPSRLVAADGSIRRLGGWPDPSRWSR